MTRTLKKIKLENFQSHEVSELEFNASGNIIRGENNSGKTAILRALEIALTGKDWSEKMISYWAKDSKITVTFTDGAKIVLTRDSKNTVYELHEADGTKNKITGVRSAKEQVQEFTGFIPVQLNKNQKTFENLQFRRAYDQQFLVHESPEIIMRKISFITSSDGLENAKINLQKELKQVNDEAKVLAKQYDEGVKKLEIVTTKHDAEVEKLYEDFLKNEEEHEEIVSTKENIEKVKKLNRATSISKEKIADLKRDFSRFKTAVLKAEDVSSYIKILNKFVVERIDIQDELRDNQNALEEYKIQLVKTKKEMKEAEKEEQVCPTCKRAYD